MKEMPSAQEEPPHEMEKEKKVLKDELTATAEDLHTLPSWLGVAEVSRAEEELSEADPWAFREEVDHVECPTVSVTWRSNKKKKKKKNK